MGKLPRVNPGTDARKGWHLGIAPCWWEWWERSIMPQFSFPSSGEQFWSRSPHRKYFLVLCQSRRPLLKPPAEIIDPYIGWLQAWFPEENKYFILKKSKKTQRYQGNFIFSFYQYWYWCCIRAGCKYYGSPTQGVRVLCKTIVTINTRWSPVIFFTT